MFKIFYIFSQSLFLAVALILCLATVRQVEAREVSDSVRMPQKRGVVLYPSDLISVGESEWVSRLRDAGINLLGIHADTVFEPLSQLEKYVKSPQGSNLLRLCAENGIEVEYELHVLQSLLPRDLFETHPEYFRMDTEGKRSQKYNICFTSEGAYRVIEQELKKVTEWLKPTTGRYFFWTDDVTDGFCHCPECEEYSASEQSLIYENRLLKMLRDQFGPKVTLAHLAYNQTLPPPIKVKPIKGIFLEYAPIGRDYSKPLSEKHQASLEENLKIFPACSAHVLEYWLDVSMFSGWKIQQLQPLPWDEANCRRDILFYEGKGIDSITTFAAWINQDFLKKYGREETWKILSEYGSIFEGKTDLPE